MPIHDWSKVDAGLFHHFHLTWSCRIADVLNNGAVPEGYYVLLERRSTKAPTDQAFDGLTDAEVYANRANRLVIRQSSGEVVSVIEIVSPGIKESQSTFQSFVERVLHFLRTGVHVLVVDLFPPNRRIPEALHPLIWRHLGEIGFESTPNKPLTLAAYVAGDTVTAYVEPIAIGDELPEMPVFLTSQRYVSVALAATYQTTWNVCPKPLKNAVLAAAT
jgi:hypothetical protein